MTESRALLPPPIHPFPARMAPEIAIMFCRDLPADALVLDPMVGSGTTIRAAIDSGHRASGVDMDPLAVLISRAWTTPIEPATFIQRAEETMEHAQRLREDEVVLPWIDDDPETSAFCKRWFGPQQLPSLRALSSALHGHTGASWDLCRVALSRIIITKDRGASLARDVSHSRPHIVFSDSNYDVFSGFRKAVDLIAKRMQAHPPRRRAQVAAGDARELPISNGSVDAIITSPPYLNAIDYLRGHRMTLVWLGYQMSQLRSIRGNEVGTERALQSEDPYLSSTAASMGDVEKLPNRLRGMVMRYAADTRAVLQCLSATLKDDGSALFVVGNSSIKGVFLRNDIAVALAAGEAGLRLATRIERQLPPNRRYLPPPTTSSTGDLNQRMRSEVVLTFVKA